MKCATIGFVVVDLPASIPAPPRRPPGPREAAPPSSEQPSPGLGPTLPHTIGLPFWFHLSQFLFLLAFAVIAMVITSYSLVVLYANNPGYGQDHALKSAFCEEMNERTVGELRYDEAVGGCVMVEREAEAR